MLAVGRAAHLRLARERQQHRPRSGSQKSSATTFGVDKVGNFFAVRGCAARPTATILDPFGINEMWVKSSSPSRFFRVGDSGYKRGNPKTKS